MSSVTTRTIAIAIAVAAALTACSGDEDEATPAAPSATAAATTAAPTTAATSAAATPAETSAAATSAAETSAAPESASPSAAETTSASESAAPAESASPSAVAAGDLPPSGPGEVVKATAKLPRTAPVRPKPARSAPALDKIAYELETDVLKTAKVVKPTKTTCSIKTLDTTKDSKFTCDVDYAGVKVPFNVDIEGGKTLFRYRKETTMGVLLREAVMAERANAGGFDRQVDVRCEVEDVKLVELEKPTGATCTYRSAAFPEDIETQDIVLTRFGIDFLRR